MYKLSVLSFMWVFGIYVISTQSNSNMNSSNHIGASQVALVVNNPPANTGDIRDASVIPGFGRSPGGGHGNHPPSCRPPQHSCLENPMDREASWASVH